jgi:hypothetical protein
VREWLRDYERRGELEAEVFDPDTREGVGLITAYDLMNFPAILVLTDEGQVIHSWMGTPLPIVDEVRGYLGA